MKHYDYLKAKKYIEDNKENIKEASLGMDEDWWWTAETVFEDGKFVIDLEEEGLRIAGICGSSWATPTLEVQFMDGEIMKFNCYTGDSERTAPPLNLFGCISGEVNEERAKIERQNIN